MLEPRKSGLLGGHLRIANVGAYSASGDGGFEMIVLADASFHAPREKRTGEGPSVEQMRMEQGAHGLHAPRLPNINYAPAVYVRLREQTPADTWPRMVEPRSFRYWRAQNNTAAVEVGPAEFYANLLTFLNFSDATFEKHAAVLRLPGAEGRRQPGPQR